MATRPVRPTALGMVSLAALLVLSVTAQAVTDSADSTPSGLLALGLQRQIPTSWRADAGWAPTTEVTHWLANETALVLIDLWDNHWCDAMAQRGVDLSLRVNRTASRLRSRGVHIAHSPSAPALAFYDKTAARARVKHAPHVAPPGPSNTTDPAPAVLQTPGLLSGCDSGQTNIGKDEPTRQSALIWIDEQRDGIVNSDDGAEAHSYFQSIGVKHLLYVGAASNMCILHRQDGTLSMSRWGYDVAVVRDEVDAMYSAKDSPYVDHAAANALQVGYIERFVCPTVDSRDLDYPKIISAAAAAAGI
jgi:hypothetical protein